MKNLALVPLFALLFSAACGGTQTTAAGPDPNLHSPDNLYPLGEGYVWSYQVDNGIEQVLGVAQVTAVIGPRIEVSALGGEPFVYEKREGGIYRPASSTWLLKAPIVEGERYG